MIVWHTPHHTYISPQAHRQSGFLHRTDKNWSDLIKAKKTTHFSMQLCLSLSVWANSAVIVAEQTGGWRSAGRQTDCGLFRSSRQPSTSSRTSAEAAGSKCGEFSGAQWWDWGLQSSEWLKITKIYRGFKMEFSAWEMCLNLMSWWKMEHAHLSITTRY